MLNSFLRLRKFCGRAIAAPPPLGVCHTPLRSNFLGDFILRLLRLIIRIRIFYFVIYVLSVVKSLFPFGCGYVALGLCDGSFRLPAKREFSNLSPF